MAYARYSWGGQRGTPQQWPPLHPQPDPDHLNPANDSRFVGREPSWVQDTAVPSLPPEIMGGEPDAVYARGGPVFDPTTDPEHGPGHGAGWTNEQASVVRQSWVLDDDGSVAATHFAHTSTVDETYHPADWSPTQTDLFSPETVDQQYNRGIGSPHAPYATPERVRRHTRWIDRFIDMHWWAPTMQLKFNRSGAGTPEVPAQSLGNNMTPFAPNAGFSYAPPDRLVWPERQVPPRPWSEPMTVDGTLGNLAGVDLGSWGL